MRQWSLKCQFFARRPMVGRPNGGLFSSFRQIGRERFFNFEQWKDDEFDESPQDGSANAHRSQGLNFGPAYAKAQSRSVPTIRPLAFLHRFPRTLTKTRAPMARSKRVFVFFSPAFVGFVRSEPRWSACQIGEPPCPI